MTDKQIHKFMEGVNYAPSVQQIADFLDVKKQTVYAIQKGVTKGGKTKQVLMKIIALKKVNLDKDFDLLRIELDKLSVSVENMKGLLK